MNTSETDYVENLFTEEQILAEMDNLPGYLKYTDVASLRTEGREITTVVLKAFAALADALKLSITVTSYHMAIQELRPESERRKSAISQLQK